MLKYHLILVLSGMSETKTVWADIIPEVGKAYIFNGISDNKPRFIGQVDMSKEDTYRVVEGNRFAFENANNALKNPISIRVEPFVDYLQ